jgi:hypothetical protein
MNIVVEKCWNNSWISVLAVLLFSLLVAGNASGQAITARSTAGTYSVICDGYLTFPNPFPPTSNPPSLQFAPAKALGTATADYSGHFIGTTQLGVDGFAVVTQTVSGTEVLNPNGTGTIQYQLCRLRKWRQNRWTLHGSLDGFFLHTVSHFQR